MRTIPILLYHELRPPNERANSHWDVSSDVFRTHLEIMLEAGHSGLQMAELADGYRGLQLLPDRPFAITFDDGFRDVVDYGLPILAELDVPATVFVTTGWVGQRIEGKQVLNWEEIGATSGSHIEFGAHAVWHDALDTLRHQDAATQIVTARKQLESRSGLDVKSFSYPHGYNSRRLWPVLERAGYTSATGVRNALSHPDDQLFDLARITITADTTRQDIEQLALGQGWPIARAGHHRVRRGLWRIARQAGGHRSDPIRPRN